MLRYGFVRLAGYALVVYGVLGLLVALAIVVVGASTFERIAGLEKTLAAQRAPLVQSLRTVSRTVADTAGATANVKQSIESARASADTASHLAFTTSLNFRDLAAGLNIQVFGLQPFAAVAPQFTASADQLEQLAITLGNTRDALRATAADTDRVGSDLTLLQQQISGVATALDQATAFDTSAQQFLPFQVAFYGMCALVVLQSVFSLVAGLALLRLLRAMSDEWMMAVFGRPRKRPVRMEHHHRAPAARP